MSPGAASLLLGVGLAATAGCQRRPPPPAPGRAAAAAAAAAPTTTPPEARFTVPLPDGRALASPGSTYHGLAVSPDGRRLAFAAGVPGKGQPTLWIRPLEVLAAHPVTGTEGALSPFWSPDSRQIGFFANGKLMKVRAEGGPAAAICDVPGGAGSATWNREGTILFAGGGRAAGSHHSDIYRVPDTGGAPVPVTDREPGMHLWPQFLPDGRHFLYFFRRDGASAGIAVAALDSDERRPLLDVESAGAFARGFLLYYRRGSTLMAHPFDDRALRFTGEPFPVAQHLTHFAPTGEVRFTVSEAGVLAYEDGEDLTRLSWFTRQGEAGETLGSPAGFREVRLTADGRGLLAVITDRRFGTSDLWTQDLAHGTSTRLSTDPGSERSGVWSPDGKQIAFSAARGDGPAALEVKALGAEAQARALARSGAAAGGDQDPCDWSPDGRRLLYVETDRRTGDQDLWLRPLEASDPPRPWRKTSARERDARFSPDGRWVAFVSDESGRAEVYVQPFRQEDGAPRLVSAGGGEQPRWRRDGKELFYLGADGTLMAVAVTATDRRLDARKPVPLFKPPPLDGHGPGYEVSADGRRFLVGVAVRRISSSPITVIVNWTTPLHQ